MSVNVLTMIRCVSVCICVAVFRVEPGVETAFLGTRSGLLRVIRYAGVEARVAK